jgi:protein required for attachment to host cells
MYKNFNLTDKERQQIMEQHKSHGYKKPLNENSQQAMAMLQQETQTFNQEVDEDLKESFLIQKNKITEMFNRFNKYN